MAEYTKINHPVAGEIEIRTDKLEQMSPQELNALLVDHVAKQLKEQGVELSSFDALTGQFAREVTSTSRGIQERAGADRTTSYEADFMSEVAFKTNPTAAWTGLLTGAILDPVTFLNPLAKASKVYNILGGVATGAGAGFLTPIREEFGESTAVTTGVGAALGGTLAAVSPALANLAPRIAKKMGFNSEKELQEAIASAPAEEKAALQQEVNSLVEEEVSAIQRMGERQREVNANRAAQEAELERIRNIDMRTEVTDADKLADIERIRQIGKDADVANIRKIGDDAVAARDADIQSRIDELRADVGTLPTGTQQKAIEQAVKENEGIAKSLEKRVANIQKAIDGLKKNKKIAPKKKREQMQPLQAELKRLQDEAALRRQQNKDTYEPLTARLKELRKAQQELRVYDKTGELPPSLKINQPVQRTAEEVKDLGLKDIPESMKAPVEEPPLTAIPEALQQHQRAPVRAAEPTPTQPTTQAETPVIQAARPSGGAAGVDILKVPTGAADAVNMNVNAKAFKDLQPRGTGGRDLTRPEEIRTARKQQLERDTESLFRVDDIEGKYTFQKLFDAADDKLEFVNREIDEGNYKDATDWLTKEFENSSSKILSPAAKMVAARIYAVAGEKLDRLDTVFRQFTRSGELSEKSLNTLYEMQVDKELHAAMDYMRNIQRIEEADKRNTSDALRAFRKANEEQKKHQEQLRNGYATRLFFGVKC